MGHVWHWSHYLADIYYKLRNVLQLFIIGWIFISLINIGLNSSSSWYLMCICIASLLLLCLWLTMQNSPVYTPVVIQKFQDWLKTIDSYHNVNIVLSSVWSFFMLDLIVYRFLSSHINQIQNWRLSFKLYIKWQVIIFILYWNNIVKIVLQVYKNNTRILNIL